MLSIAAMSGGQERYYLDLARDDYYLAGGEPPGQWIGRGAQALGLQSTVERDVLRSALAGQGPGGVRLTQAQRYTTGRARQPGWDLTFSAPKSVSALWSQADAKTRSAIQAAHATAVASSLSYLEDCAAVSRRGKGGTDAEAVGLLVASFEHGTSRAQDPQLHTHCLVINAGLRSDGTWGALRSHDLYLHKMVAGTLYRSQLAHELKHGLGLDLVREKGKIGFEIVGVPKSLVEIFSTRRHEIEAAMAEHGWGSARGAELLAKRTRSVKSHTARDELFARWQQVGMGLGFGVKEARGLLGPASRPERSQRTLDRKVTKVIDDVMKSESYFLERNILRRAAETTQADGYSIPRLREAVRRTIDQDPKLVVIQENGRNAVYTTKEVRETERRLLDLGEATKEASTHSVSQSVLQRVLDDRPTIKPEQKRGLEYLTQGKGSIQLVSGMAGTGKSYLLGAARECWAKAGYTVYGCAVAARAALQLEAESGIESMTIRGFLRKAAPEAGQVLGHHVEQLANAARGRKTFTRDKLRINKKTILVVDEAGMASTKDIERIASKVLSAGGKVVLVGDERQLQPIESGSSFAALRKQLGGVELREITRQTEPWMQDAVRQFADGDARGALSQYALAERLHVLPDKATAEQRLISDWQDQRTSDLKETIILAGTRESVERLNNLAQATRLKLGELKSSGAVKSQGQLLHIGDRVMFTENNRALGIVNGDMGTIEKTSRRGLLGKASIQVRVDRTSSTGRGKSKPIRVTAELGPKLKVQLGYAMTVHKAQGATVDKSFVLAGGWMQDRELAYVQMSRSRDETRIYASDADAGEDLANLAQSMSHSKAKKIAHETQEHPREGETQKQTL